MPHPAAGALILVMKRAMFLGSPSNVEAKMAKEIRCADLGLDCDFVTSAESTEELLSKVVTHAMTAHGITEITPELQQKVASAVRDTPAEA
jgi:predicted small metal-binding protein